MTAATPGPVAFDLPPLRRLHLSARFVPSYVWHLTVRPYRRRSPVERPGAPHAAAALDAWVGHLLATVRRLTAAPGGSVAGALVVHYMRLLSALNREFEYRLATGRPLGLTQLRSAPVVTGPLQEWNAFAEAQTACDAIVDFLDRADFVTDYAAYVEVTTAPEFTTDVDLQLESIVLDSGGYLARVVRLVCELGGHPPDSGVLQQFRAAGVAAKLTDEFTDLITDRREGRYNLLWTLLRHEPAELERVELRMADGAPMPVAWWRTAAPRSLGRLADLYERSLGEIDSAALRVVCDLTLLRALNGPRPRQTTRPAQHVTEPPMEAWR
jgi:hypothetical protein